MNKFKVKYLMIPIIIFPLPIYLVGIENFFILFGASSMLYFLLPLLIAIGLKFKELQLVSWSSITVTSSLLFLNYISLNSPAVAPNLISIILIVWIPAICLVAGLVFLFSSFLKQEKGNCANYREQINSFLAAVIALVHTPLLLIFPFIFLSKRSEPLVGIINVTLILVSVGFLAVLMGTVILDLKRLSFFLNKFFIDNVNALKKARILGFTFIFFLLYSLSWEARYRSQWLLAISTIIVYLLYLLIMFKLLFNTLPIFTQFISCKRPLYPLSIKQRGTQIYIFCFGLIFLISLFYVSITNPL